MRLQALCTEHYAVALKRIQNGIGVRMRHALKRSEVYDNRLVLGLYGVCACVCLCVCNKHKICQ